MIIIVITVLHGNLIGGLKQIKNVFTSTATFTNALQEVLELL